METISLTDVIKDAVVDNQQFLIEVYLTLLVDGTDINRLIVLDDGC